MRAPQPVPGLVTRYGFLWRREALNVRKKVARTVPTPSSSQLPRAQGGTDAIVLPRNHSPLSDPATAVELPPRIKLQRQLDHERSWIVLDEADEFLWPRFDIRPSEA